MNLIGLLIGDLICAVAFLLMRRNPPSDRRPTYRVEVGE